MEVCTIGGYEEVGKNMTAVKVGEDVVIFDAGLYLPPLIEMQENEEQQAYDEKTLRKIKALPSDKILDKKGWSKKVKAIVIGHAHLDHVGGAPYIAQRYPQAEILATSFTMEVLNSLCKDQGIHLKNKKRKIESNSRVEIKGNSDKIDLEFIHTTHSTIQSVFVAWHTKEGTLLYALDFKFDKHPTMGPPPNYKRLKELKKKGVKCLIVDSLYSDTERRTPSERIAKNMLEDAFSSVKNDKEKALFVTTFSSHIARLKSIVEFGKRTGRQIVFLGRSLHKYVEAAHKSNQCPFYKDIKLVKYGKQVQSTLKKVQKDRGKYLVVCTGHQGEKGAILNRIAMGETGFEFKSGDNVIISSSVIPVYPNITARKRLDKKLRGKGVRLQTDIHVSGHGGREDLRDLLEILDPEHIVPAHGTLEQETPMVELGKEMGYKFKDNIQLSSDGKVIKL
ncbi:MAG: RNase J family beta-CASP ribonuclease [Candidatus Pacearchaeota archaeon]